MKIKIGLAQISPRLGDLAYNLELHEETVAKAQSLGVELLLFPELSLSGYFVKDLVPNLAINPRSKEFARLKSLAQEMALVVGFVEEGRRYRFYNAAAYIAGGEVRHIHRKVYLPTYGLFDEMRYFAQGESIRAFDTGWGRAALLICEDLWHPSAAYVASQDGADLLFCISASPARGIGSEIGIYSSRAWETLNFMYAQFFSSFVLYVNRVGYEDGVNFWGGSQVLNPAGQLVANAPYFKEDLLVAEIDLKDLKRARSAVPLLRDEKLDLTLRELKRIQKQRIANNDE
jgi:predicted amidohydrolase